MNPNSKQFKELQKTWYDKLKNTKSKQYPEGFNDIEQDNGMLKTWESSHYTKHKYNGLTLESWLVSKQAQVEYYTLARQWTHEHKFKSKEEKKLWELHAEGMSYREMQKKTGINYSVLSRRMKALAMQMFAERKAEDDDTDGIDSY